MSFLYPFNAYTAAVKTACEKGRTGSRTYQFALGQRNSSCTLQSVRKWLRDVIDNREWGGSNDAWNLYRLGSMG